MSTLASTEKSLFDIIEKMPDETPGKTELFDLLREYVSDVESHTDNLKADIRYLENSLKDAEEDLKTAEGKKLDAETELEEIRDSIETSKANSLVPKTLMDEFRNKIFLDIVKNCSHDQVEKIGEYARQLVTAEGRQYVTF